MATAEQLAAKMGVTCDSCLEECLMSMQIFTGPTTEIPVYKRKDFYRKLEDQFWLHNQVIMRKQGIQ